MHNQKRFGLFVLVITVFSQAGHAVLPEQEPLLNSGHLSYLGAFKLPPGPFPTTQYGFAYADTGIAFNPINGTLFVNNHVYEQKTAEITIPTPSLNAASLPTASIVQNPVDVAEGKLNSVSPGGVAQGNGAVMGGLLVHNNKLIGSSYGYYDANSDAVFSHFTHSLTVSQAGSFQGMYRVAAPGLTLNSAYFGGYMAAIPPQWQSATYLGGPAITGQCCISIISRSSTGPSAFVFDPALLVGAGYNTSNVIPATPLVYYEDGAHSTLGLWSNTTVAGNDFNMTSSVRGAVFPVGSRSVLFFGRQGLGVPCYGEGGATAPAGAVHWCYDPANVYKGTHAYPYAYWIWAYDAADLWKVKKGQLNPWDVKPYARWEVQLPIFAAGALADADHAVQGVAYDPATQRIYFAQKGGEAYLPGSNVNNQTTLIHMFQINLAPPPFLGCDANRDGSTNISDVQSSVVMALGSAACTADINLDGLCTIVDVQRIVVAALGGTCVSP